MRELPSNGTIRMPNRPQEGDGLLFFRSILFDDSKLANEVDGREPPEFFRDLNLDQIVESITTGRDEYNLKPFFYVPLSRVEAIHYRYDVMRELENQALAHSIQSFAQGMREMRSHLVTVDKLYYKLQKQSWFLDAVEIYCAAVERLSRDLESIDLRSGGFLSFRDYLSTYERSSDFQSLVAETRKLHADLAEVKYCLHIEGKRITVNPYGSQSDYGADVLQTFDKFKQGAPKEYRFIFSATPDMNHVEAAILDLVAKLYPDTFSTLEEYCRRHLGYLDHTIGTFDREVQFYIACLEHIARFKPAELSFCYPRVVDHSKEIHARDTFDLALAHRLIQNKTPVVVNEFHLKNPERILVVSGPNQGGKTTFARTFGQLHYLASIGCPVPGKEASLFLHDRIFTHFEKEEDIQNLSSKLEDDLIRIHRILEHATARSILIMNESFLSTTLDDALFLSKHILQKVIELDMLCVSVTFLDELADLSETTVSMVSTVDPIDPVLRTFKVIRKPADGLAYAVAIAAKHRVTYENIKARLARDGKG